MGLDIYLYTKADGEKNKAHDEASEAFYGRPDYDDLTEQQRKELRDALPPYVGHVDVPSERHPDHLFNRRYLRSSYNDGGFNHAVPQMLGVTADERYPHQEGSLYWIFTPMSREWDGDEGVLTTEDLPKLAECRARALDVAERIRKCDPLRALTVSPNMFSPLPTTTADEALARYRNRQPSSVGPDTWYSTADMEVFGNGMTILAAIPGVASFGIPGVHLIYRNAAVDSYADSADITAEFCDEAIGLIERDGSCVISWSG